MNLSVVITTRNRYLTLLGCLESLKKDLIANSKSELLIIDDCSSDKTKQIDTKLLKKFTKNSKIFHFKKQLMMVKARNFGAKRAKGRFVLFIDDDNILDKKAINNLIEQAELNSNYGILGPQMCYSDKECYMLAQKFNFYTGLTSRLIPNKQNNHQSFLNSFLVSRTKNSSSKKIYLTDGIPNVFLIKKEVFEKCGYFDEKLIQTYTELDFALHVRKFGYLSAIFPKSITYHQITSSDDFAPEGLGAKFKQKAYCLMRNRSVVAKRYGNNLQKPVYFLLFSWLWFLVYSSLAIRNKRVDLVKIYFYGFKDGLIYFLSGKLINSLPKII